MTTPQVDLSNEFPVAYTPAEGEKGPAFRLGDTWFHVVVALPIGWYFDLPVGSNATVDDLYRFVRGAIVEEEEELFDRVTRNKRAVVDAKVLLGVQEWMLHPKGGGLSPFAPSTPRPSSNGDGTTGDGSPAG